MARSKKVEETLKEIWLPKIQCKHLLASPTVNNYRAMQGVN